MAKLVITGTIDFLPTPLRRGNGVKGASVFLSTIPKFNYKSVRIIGKNIRKLCKDRLIMRKVVTTHSRSRCRRWAAAKRQGK